MPLFADSFTLQSYVHRCCCGAYLDGAGAWLLVRLNGVVPRARSHKYDNRISIRNCDQAPRAAKLSWKHAANLLNSREQPLECIGCGGEIEPAVYICAIEPGASTRERAHCAHVIEGERVCVSARVRFVATSQSSFAKAIAKFNYLISVTQFDDTLILLAFKLSFCAIN